LGSDTRKQAPRRCTPRIVRNDWRPPYYPFRVHRTIM